MLDLRDSGVYRWKEVNIGVAVARQDGLIVPVIPDADQRSLSEISSGCVRSAETRRIDLLWRSPMRGNLYHLQPGDVRRRQPPVRDQPGAGSYPVVRPDSGETGGYRRRVVIRSFVRMSLSSTTVSWTARRRPISWRGSRRCSPGLKPGHTRGGAPACSPDGLSI